MLIINTYLLNRVKSDTRVVIEYEENIIDLYLIFC